MPAKLTLLDDAVEVDLAGCRGSDFQDALAKVRDIPGRRFHTETAERADGTEYTRKVWLIPRDPKAAEKAVYSMQPDVDSDVLDWIREASVTADAELVSTLPDDADDLLIPWATTRADWQPDHVNGAPFTGLKAHQRALVSAIAAQEHPRAIVADDMGLGKTLQAISIVAEKMAQAGLVAPIKPSLIVSPNSVKGVWSRELLRWLGDVPVQVIDATTPAARHNQLDRIIAERGWAIVNYEQLRTVKEKVKLKNGGSKTVEA
jgi:SNF2 family DNA or RNA helicase